MSYSTASPDKLDTIFFDFCLEHEGQTILSSFSSEFCLYDLENNKINAHIKFGERFYLDKKAHCTRLNEYKWSQLFENILRSMKKFELAEIDVMPTEQFSENGLKCESKDKGLDKLFSWGKDFETTKKFLEKLYSKPYQEVLEECKFMFDYF
jgi:hypothetical protein